MRKDAQKRTPNRASAEGFPINLVQQSPHSQEKFLPGDGSHGAPITTELAAGISAQSTDHRGAIDAGGGSFAVFQKMHHQIQSVQIP